MKKTIFEEMGGTYIRHGDYLIPALTLPKEEEQRVVGVWGQRHLRYLKEYRRLLYLNMLTSGRLNGYLADIEENTGCGRGAFSPCAVSSNVSPSTSRFPLSTIRSRKGLKLNLEARKWILHRLSSPPLCGC